MPQLDERDIFDAARRIYAPDARRLYLARACENDSALLARVEALLRVHDEDGAFLQSPAVPHSAEAAGIDEGPGARIGPYKLIEVIGEGGFGIVFVAEQQQPLRRIVALKIVKPGMDTREVVARFEAERQALAMMDHPNIAHVFDGGTTESGRPYFVMELVKGVPITRYCDEHQLTPRDRLQLFGTVCQAVQHAHQKGLIHRDLKPTNVLVAAYDGLPVPKVIDFGVAKALGERLTERTLVTGFGSIVGTLEYMSPEQAEFNARDVDTRADVYSLGVLLYELLTGTTPLTRERLKHAAMMEALQLIREEEPPRPSTRLSEPRHTLTTVSAQRNLETEKLAHELRGDLDWIVMKALEKDRERRYQTANGLARDIERFLHNEPVEACPPTTAYRLWKFLRRHRGPAVAVGAVLAVLAGGIAATSVGFLSARAAQRRAEENFEIAKNAVDDYLNEVTEDPDLKRSDFNALRKKLLESAEPFYQRLTEQKPGDVVQEAARGQACGRLGELRRQMGETAQALADFEQMRSIFARLAANFPAAAEYRRELAASQSNLGMVMEKIGRRDEAEAAYRAALVVLERLAADFPTASEYREDLAATRNKLGWLLSGLGKRDEAAAAYRDALAIYETLAADSAVSEDRGAARRQSVGWLLTGLGKHDEAEAAFRDALSVQEKLAADFPALPEYRENLATTRSMLGLLLTALRRHDEAEAVYRDALAIWEKLATEFPTIPEYRRNLATTSNKLGLLLTALGRHDEAEAAYRAAMPIYERLAVDFPAVPEYRYVLAHTLNNLGWLLQKEGKREEAEAVYRAALAIYEKLAADFPTAPVYSEHLATTRHNLGLLMARLGKLTEAEAAFRASLAIWEKLSADFPAALDYREHLAETRQNLGQIHARKSQWEQAAASFARAIELDPSDDRTAYRLGFLLAEQGERSAYQEYCNTMLSRWGNVADPMRAAATAKACLLLAGGVPDPEQLAPLVQTALSLGEKHELYQWVLFAKGLHDYRCGRFSEALGACANGREQAQSYFAALPIADQMVEAMSLYRLGKIDEGRQALAAANRVLNEQRPQLTNDLGELWHDWLCCQILRREASGLIDGQ